MLLLQSQPLIWQGGLLLSIFAPSLPQLDHLVSAALPLPGPPLPQPSHHLVLQRHTAKPHPLFPASLFSFPCEDEEFFLLVACHIHQF
ncbi:hypothetical protein MHYP_G00028160 [Metynnis hypsauchen]